jgi:hypothetical protein
MQFLALKATFREEELMKIAVTILKKTTYKCSHLCHYTQCFNSEHLVVETRNMNKNQMMCAGQMKLKCECGKIISLCKHSPPCILPEPDDSKLAEKTWRQINEGQRVQKKGGKRP